MVAFTAKAAATYDARIVTTVPGRSLLHALLGPVLQSALPPDASAEQSVLAAGAGTGTELTALAQHHPHWRFTAVDPSDAMLALARERAEAAGFADRLSCHAVPMADYAATAPHDAAISLLVAQFLPDTGDKQRYFQALHDALKPGAPLVFADWSGADNERLRLAYAAWLQTTGKGETEAQSIVRHVNASFHSVSEPRLSDILGAAGFVPPVPFFQALDYRGFLTRRR